MSLLLMYDEPMRSAIEAARVRLANDTVIARCAEEFWLVEVDGAAVADGLSFDDALDAIAAL